MSKASEKKQEMEDARELLNSQWKEVILNRSTLLEFKTEYMKGQETDYVSCRIYYVGSDGRITAHDLTALIARAWNDRMRKHQYKAQIAVNGGGMSKSYGVALKLFSVLGVEHRETEINFTY